MLMNFIKNTGVIICIISGSIFLNKFDNQVNEVKLDANLPFAVMAQEVANELVVEMVLGKNEAPISIVEYAAYTCIHCATFHKEIYPRLKSEFIDTDKVKFTYREFYFHRWGLWGSMIARCANNDQKVFFGVTDQIYKKRDAWLNKKDDDQAALSELKKIGKFFGLTDEKLESCLADKEKLTRLVEWWQSNKQLDEINSTPTLIIDGEKFEVTSYDQLAAFLNEKLLE